MATRKEYLNTLKKDFFYDCKYSKELVLNHSRDLYFLDLTYKDSIEDLFIKVREVFPLDPDLSDEEAKNENWDALNDCISGGVYLILEKNKKFIICVKGIECFSEKNSEIWLFLDILREAFKDSENIGQCEIIYIK